MSLGTIGVLGRTSTGYEALASARYRITERVAGGFYVSGNGDPRPATTAIGTNLGGLTQYHSFAEVGASQYPGYQKPWIPELVAAGVWLNLVLELKSYGTTVAQSFAVIDRGASYSYRVPAMAGAIQLGRDIGPGTPAYTYAQVTSGACDGLLHRTLAALRAIPAAGRINVQVHCELDTDTQYGVRVNGVVVSRPTADVAGSAAAEYIIRWMRNPPGNIAPAPAGVTFSMGWAGQQWSEDSAEGRGSYVRTHPDSLPVDYAMWNVYNHSGNWSAYDRLSETLARHRETGPAMRFKNIIVAEWGSSSAWTGGQAAYIKQWGPALNRINAEQMARQREGQYVMTNYYSSRDNTWGLLDPADPGRQALRACYAASPFARVA